MKPIRCRLGRHDYSVSQHVEPDGSFTVMVYEDKLCKRCGKHLFGTYRRSILD